MRMIIICILPHPKIYKICVIFFLSLLFLLSTCLTLDEVSWTKLKGKAFVTVVQPNLSIEEKWSLEGLNKITFLSDITLFSYIPKIYDLHF